MGSAASTGENNKELVDNLMRLDFIQSKDVERVFRVVDRGNYFLSSLKQSVYNDLAWKYGNLHLSAPCIYSKVLEALALKPGLSFLNIGSGTGYLSTMAGLLLSSHGINHGIELHEDCLRYAYDKLEEFKKNSVALDQFDFCEPVFIRGNCLNVVPDRQYDRVYCGAACPEQYRGFIKQFVKIGGILVMPTNEHLLCLHRSNNDTWITQSLLPVSFETLVIPPSGEHNVIRLPECVPRSLQEICRDGIRQSLRKNVWLEHTGLKTTGDLSSFPSHQRIHGNFVTPTFVELDSTSSDDDVEDLNSDYIIKFLKKEHQERRSITENQISHGNIVMEQNEDANLIMETQNEIRPSNSYMSTINQDSIQARRTSQQRSSDSQDTEVSERRNSTVSMDDSSSEEDSQNQSTLDTTLKRRLAYCEPKSLAGTLAQYAGVIDSDEEMEGILKNTHHVDNDAFRAYMTEKIFQLPLPFFLQMYINYNRKL